MKVNHNAWNIPENETIDEHTEHGHLHHSHRHPKLKRELEMPSEELDTSGLVSFELFLIFVILFLEARNQKGKQLATNDHLLNYKDLIPSY